VVPSSCLIAKGVNMESESGNTARNIKEEVKVHVFGKWVRRTQNQGPVCRWTAPLITTCALLDVCWGKAPSQLYLKQTPASGSKVHSKTIKVNGFTVLQILYESVGMCQALIAERICEDQQSSGPELSRTSACKIFFIVVLSPLRVKDRAYYASLILLLGP